ncbi:MAG: zinc-ribbon domain-containing protein [Eubacterium sp.]|nr:zinc-ribbon domain-containing protein [Eubacterium sp.]
MNKDMPEINNVEEEMTTVNATKTSDSGDEGTESFITDDTTQKNIDIESVKEDSDGKSICYCVKCGYPIPKDFKLCPKCGAKTVGKKAVNKKIIIVPGIVVIVIALLVGGYFGINYYQDNSVYQKANKYVDEGKFDEALKQYNAIPDFKDVKTKIKATKYAKAEKLFAEKKYDEAIEVLKNITDYKDVKTKIKATKYAKAEELFAENKYDEAIEVFREISDYKDVTYKINDVKEAKEKAAELEEIMELKNTLEAAADECTSSGTQLSSDGMSIEVDGKDEYDADSLIDIYTIAAKLNLPESLMDEMLGTNALMGRQEESFDHISVSWSYHPDNGLDAVFKIIK